MTLDGQPVNGFTYNKARALLAYLAVESQRAHSREALVGLLWPDLPEDVARTNLRQALSALRQVISDAAASPPFLHVTRDSIQFNAASSLSLDVTNFTQHLAACEHHPHRHSERCAVCIDHMQQAIALYQGDFLAGFSLAGSTPFEEWVLLWRERLHQLAQGALVRLADYHERHGSIELARRAATRQIEMDPWREEAHRQMMRLLVASGQRSAALAQYERCRRVLLKELGVEPEAETTTLYKGIRSGPAPNADNATEQIEMVATLPIPPTPLVGRERELAQLDALLVDPLHRIITVLGPGGVGKTRLALAAAAALADAFADGVAFIPDAEPVTAERLADLMLAALNVRSRVQCSPQDQILNYLYNKEMLLVLDGFQPCADNARFLNQLLQRAPRVTVMVTSRRRLAVRAEWLLALTGLDYPPEETSVGLMGYSAIQFFAQQWHQLQGHDPSNDLEWQAVAHICRLVEGNPLTIERAVVAAWSSSIMHTATACETDRHARPTHGLIEKSPNRLSLDFRQTKRAVCDLQRPPLDRKLGVCQTPTLSKNSLTN